MQCGLNSITNDDQIADKLNLVLTFHDSFFKNCEKTLKNSNLKIIPGMKKKFPDIVKLGKDAITKKEKTGSVFKILCDNCRVSYKGQTKKALKKKFPNIRKTPTPSPLFININSTTTKNLNLMT